MDVQPKEAVKYYNLALRVADEIGMDPFSDEILGVKIQVASLMEKVQQYQKAIDVLEIVRSDCLKWMDQLGSKPGNEGKRTRVLGKTVGISVKLGDLYANQYVLEPDLAEEKLIWAVETVLKEQQRRELEGVKEAEGPWMNNEEMGGAFECETIPAPLPPNTLVGTVDLTTFIALAHNYEEKNRHYLAAPLFLQAIGLIPQNNCHSVVLSKYSTSST